MAWALAGQMDEDSVTLKYSPQDARLFSKTYDCSPQSDLVHHTNVSRDKLIHAHEVRQFGSCTINGVGKLANVAIR